MTDEFREAVEREFVVERDGWAGERAARVTERLQRDVPVGERFETLIVWWQDHEAFTMIGRTIYISRRLWERFPDDETAAFVVAHELAHHRLGHLPKPVSSRLWRLSLLMVRLEHKLRSRIQEADADKLAIEMCMAAGYDPARCLEAFEILSLITLDYGDLDGEFGGDPDSSHPSVRERVAAVRAYVERVRAGHRFDVQASIAADRARRRRRIIAAVGGAVSVAAALVVFRRWPR